MRRLAIFLTLLMAMAQAMAETHYKPHISVGGHGGVSMSQMSFYPSVKQSWGLGATMGVSIRYAEEKLVGILGELNLVQRGWKENFEEGPLSYQRTLTYASLPIMTHINFGSKRCRTFFNLGPEFGFLIAESTSANFDYHNPTAAEGWPSKKRMTEQLTTAVKNKFDYGICVGVGCEFWLKPRHSIYVEARYYYGLGNIFPATKADTFSASRNMTLSATIGYNFRLE